MKYNLVTIRPKGFLHSSAFNEVKDSLGWALVSLGHQTISSENAYAHNADTTNIIFGSELLSEENSVPPNSIIYNLEQPSHPKMEVVRKLAKGKQVWDYNQKNIEIWSQWGIPAKHVPVGYTPNLTRIPKSENQDIDVFFAGWMTPRRRAIQKELIDAGINAIFTDFCYGGGRDNLISRSKICLNLNHDGRDLFNIVRVSYLLANAKCVISETASDQQSYDLEQSIEFRCYEDLIPAIQLYLRDTELREQREFDGFQAIKSMDYIQSVKNALEGSTTTLNPIQARYQAGLQSGDMKDFLPTLRSLAKGNVLEIGVRDGASTSALLLGLEEKGGQLTSVDISDCYLWEHPQWSFVQMDSKQLGFLDGALDMAFIDGDHSPDGFLADLENCLRWVKPGGIILCHDISPLPNYTKEARGGDWPSQYIGEQFFQVAKERKLRHFIYPGAWGLGVIVKDCQ